mmetsp:Transcript_7995/g.18720  ORF Transcript_7995/g.18720 Transcript_7995/m.18720 type:complete len:384 (-) Transcript_7995:1492-2643(-)
MRPRRLRVLGRHLGRQRHALPLEALHARLRQPGRLRLAPPLRRRSLDGAQQRQRRSDVRLRTLHLLQRARRLAAAVTAGRLGALVQHEREVEPRGELVRPLAEGAQQHAARVGQLARLQVRAPLEGAERRRVGRRAAPLHLVVEVERRRVLAVPRVQLREVEPRGVAVGAQLAQLHEDGLGLVQPPLARADDPETVGRVDVVRLVLQHLAVELGGFVQLCDHLLGQTAAALLARLLHVIKLYVGERERRIGILLVSIAALLQHLLEAVVGASPVVLGEAQIAKSAPRVGAQWIDGERELHPRRRLVVPAARPCARGEADEGVRVVGVLLENGLVRLRRALHLAARLPQHRQVERRRDGRGVGHRAAAGRARRRLVRLRVRLRR